MASKDIPLSDLHSNSYNPRKRFDDAAMADLIESIESVGLDHGPTVRENEGGYEVVSGIRRLKALRDIHGKDSDVLIPCNVRELDDDEAQWSALAENLAREDLTAVEEARAYAKYVTVEYREDDDGEPIEETYAEYIKEAKNRDSNAKAPRHQTEDVQSLSQRVPASAGVVQDRLSLLVLPKEVLTTVESGELPVNKARITSDILRGVPDAGYREKQMARIAQEAVAHSHSESDVRERANAARDEWEQQQQQDLERIENFADAATSAESDLRSGLKATVEWYNDRDEPDESLDMDGDRTLPDAAETVIEALSDRIAVLGGDRLTALDDEESDRKQERNRLQQNLEIVREEGHDRCPFCKAGILVPDIEERIEEFEREIEAVREQKEALNDNREAYRDRRSDLRGVLNDFFDACSRLRTQLDKADVAADDIDATVPDAVTAADGGGE